MSQPIWDSDDVKQIDFFLKVAIRFKIIAFDNSCHEIENWYWKLPPLFSSKLQSIAYDVAWLMSVDSSYRTFMCVYLWEVVVSITYTTCFVRVSIKHLYALIPLLNV